MSEYDEDGTAPRWGGSVEPSERNDPVEEEEFDPTYGELGALPIFASVENQKLDHQVKVKTKKLDTCDKDLEDNAARVKVMKEHLKNVKQELKHTQSLVDTKMREIRTEEHLKQLAQREAGRCQQQLRGEIIKKEDAQDRLNVIQNDIFKGNERMDKFKLQMNWNQEELEQWALAAKQKEEDNLAMEKYTRADETKIKELSLQLEKLTEECARAKQALEDEVTETQAKQIELDKTAVEFRTLHRERQNLVRQWQESLETMKRRDHEIGQAGEAYADALSFLREKEAKLQEHLDMLEMHQKDNKEAVGRRDVQERLLQQARNDHQKCKEGFMGFEDQVEVVRNELASAASDLVAKRAAVVNNRALLDQKKQKLDAARKKYQKVKRVLDSNVIFSDNVESRAKAAEEGLKQTEVDLKVAEKEVATMKQKLFKLNQTLFSRRQAESNMIAEIDGSRAAAKNLTHKIRRLDAQALRQQELIYNAEFQIQQLERRVSRASGVRTDEEKKVLNAKIEVLRAELAKAEDQHKMLRAQQTKLDDELRKTQSRKRGLEKKREHLKERINELDLINGAAASELDKQQKRRDGSMVENDVMKLEVKRLKKILSAKADEVYGLENRKFQLRMSMEERKKEIEVHEEVQRAELKVAEEERHKLQIELKEREAKVRAAKSKYEILARAARGSSDGGEEMSQAYFVIKAAQMREELQREGDELDAKIRTAEREIRALEATLNHLVKRNAVFRSGFQKADMRGERAAELAELEEKVKRSSDLLFKKRKELQRVVNDAEDDRSRLQQVREQLKHLARHQDHLMSALDMVRKELRVETDAMVAMEKKVRKASTTHRKTMGVGPTTVTEEEKILHAKAIHENNENVLFTLRELANEFPEMQSALMITLQKEKLQLPSRPPSRASSGRPSTGGSSRSVESAA